MGSSGMYELPDNILQHISLESGNLPIREGEKLVMSLSEAWRGLAFVEQPMYPTDFQSW